MEIVLLLIGILAGATIGFLLGKNQRKETNTDTNSTAIIAEQRLTDSNAERTKLESENKQLQLQIIGLNNETTAAKTQSDNLREEIKKGSAEMEKLQLKFAQEFENLANRIFEEKGKMFADQNQQNLNQLLKPFQENITKFEKKVNEVYDVELRDKISLREEVRKLYDLNSKISEEANSLTKALKGDTKKQGNWGETILERVLEQSGLKKGIEYETQVTTTNQEGDTIRPDVVVSLPDNKHIIIDSKVSLIAYERFVNADDETERNKFLNDHLQSVRNHIKQLSEKNYFTGKNLRTPDFVLLFIPIESSFAAAIQNDIQLYNYAWEKRIVMVSPTTLLATLMTVSSLWKIENQNKNHVEIARLAGEMFDKLVNFSEDMLALGNNLNTAKKKYDEAMNKFSEGNGNAIKTSEKIKALGAKTSKSFNQGLIERSAD